MTVGIYLLSIGSFFFLGFQVQRWISGESNFWKIGCGSLANSCACLLLGVGLMGRILHSFDLGVLSGAAVAAVGGVYLWKEQRTRPLRFKPHINPWDIPLLLFALLSTLGIAWISLQNSLHDERMVQGHPALVESMLRGTYPLYFLPFPSIPNKYHIGFNLLAAVFSKAFGVPGTMGVDIAAIFLWVALIGTLALVLLNFGVPRRLLAIGVAFVIFSGGLGWLIGGNDASHVQAPGWQYVTVAGRWIHFNFVFYFFQHPISLGVLIFLGSFDLFRRWLNNGSARSLITASLSLGVLSLAHVMFFATLLLALGLLIFFRFFSDRHTWKKNLASGIFILLASVGVAYALGGYFQWPSSHFSSETAKLAWPPGYLTNEYYNHGQPISWTQASFWYLHSFGIFLVVLLPVFFLTFCRRNQALWLMGLYCMLSILIPNLVYYAYSSNVQKWFLSFEFSGKILCAVVLLPLCAGKIWRVFLANVVLLVSMGTPFKFVYGMTLKADSKRSWGERRIVAVRHLEPRGAFRSLIELLKARVEDVGMVWATASTGRSLAIFTGYPVLDPDNVVSMPVSRVVIEQRYAQLRQLFSNPTEDLLQTLQVRWVIFSCTEVPTLAPPVQKFIESLKAMPGVQDLSVQGKGRDCYYVLKIPKA